MTEFTRGDRVRWSALGIAQLRPRDASSTGTVCGFGRGWRRNRIAWVLWDGRSTREAYGVDFLDKVEAGPRFGALERADWAGVVRLAAEQEGKP